MGQTARDALPYPEATDEVDVPTDMAELAVAVENELHTAYPCLSTARPTGVGDGFIIRETDTGLWWGYNGTTWVGLSAGTGGGGSTASYRAHAGTSAQGVGTGSVATAFGTEADPDPLVTRVAYLAGHKFVLGAAGIWAINSTVRVASTSVAGEFSLDLIEIAGDRSLDIDGGRREGLPRSLSVHATEYLPAGTELFVKMFNGTGSTRTLEPDSGNWVHFSAALIA